MNNFARQMLIVLTFGLMLAQGFLDNIRGVVIPLIKGDFGVSYTSMATMMLLSTLGYILATFLGGIVIDRIGQKRVIMTGSIVTFVAVLAISLVKSYFLFVIFMFLLGHGLGLLTIGASTLAPVIFIHNQGIMMNLLHFFYGLGATLGPRYAGKMLSLQVEWRVIYKYSSIAIILVFVYFLFCKFPQIEETKKREKLPLKEILKNRRVMLFAIILGFYVASEVGIANWLVTYLQNAKKISDVKSASYLSLFFMIFTFGRLIGGFIVEKLGYMRSIWIFVFSALCCLLIGVFGSSQWLIVLSIGGFFFSIVYPTVMAILIKTFDRGMNSIIGVVMTLSSGINMIANWLIGRMNDVFNESIGFSMIILYLMIILLLLRILKKDLEQSKA